MVRCCSLKRFTEHVKFEREAFYPHQSRAVILLSFVACALVTYPESMWILVTNDSDLAIQTLRFRLTIQTLRFRLTIQTLLGNHHTRLQLPPDTALQAPLVQLLTMRRAPAVFQKSWL